MASRALKTYAWKGNQTMETYDIILIGSGHNALIAAAYLTRSGHSVLVLEKNDRPGGLVSCDTTPRGLIRRG